MEEVAAERREDGWRDALAFLAAVKRDDDEGVGAVLINCDGVMLVAALASMLFGALEDRQVDPADWIENEQRILLGT